jgi:hypothetical protein
VFVGRTSAPLACAGLASEAGIGGTGDEFDTAGCVVMMGVCGLPFDKAASWVESIDNPLAKAGNVVTSVRPVTMQNELLNNSIRQFINTTP